MPRVKVDSQVATAVCLQVHYNSLAPKSCSDSSLSSASESGSEDEGRRKIMGSARLGRLFG